VHSERKKMMNDPVMDVVKQIDADENADSMEIGMKLLAERIGEIE
jgi:hypothetical protein